MDIYIPNKYSNTYFAIVNRSFSENRSRKDSRIYEHHHIIPKSCGGSDEPNNLVLLTPKEHYICHRLLPKMVKSKLHYEKMIYALWCMINGSKGYRISPNGKIYQQVREEQSKIRSKRMKGKGNHFYGKTHSDEFKKWISENNPAKREETKEKMRGPRPGYLPHNHYNGWDDETKQKLREANLGKTHTEETKLKMSKTRSEKVWIKKEGEKSKHIQLHEVEKYLGSGWEFGRHLKLQTKKRNKYTEDQKKALSDKLSNRIWIKKDGESSKHIDATDFEIYSTMGWSRGRGNNGKGRKS